LPLVLLRSRSTPVTSETIPRKGHTAWMPLSCGWNDMNAAFTSYEEAAGPVPAVTGVHKSLYGTTGITAR
jgi:hypothetical protein